MNENILHDETFLTKKNLLATLINTVAENKIEKKCLMFCENTEGKSALTLTIESGNTIGTQIVLDAISKFCDDSAFNRLVDKHFIALLETKCNLSEYNQSPLPYFEILLAHYPTLHTNDEYKIVPYNGGCYLNLRREDNLFRDIAEKEGQTKIPINYFVLNMPQTL